MRGRKSLSSQWRREMSKKDLSRYCKNIDENNWYHEEPIGIEIIHRSFDIHGEPTYHHITIPWRKLKGSLKRLEK